MTAGCQVRARVVAGRQAEDMKLPLIDDDCVMAKHVADALLLLA